MRVEFLFDVGSPNAYLAHKAIPQIEQRSGVRFEYVPILLGGVFKATNNKSPIEAFGGVRNKLGYMMIETRRFLDRYKVAPWVMNPAFPVNTLALMRAAVAVQMDGDPLRPYVDAAFHHMWEAPKKMDDPQVAKEALTASGIDAERLFARAQEADVKARLAELTQNAVERGVFGSPTFFVGDELYFGKETLREVEEAALAKAAS